MAENSGKSETTKREEEVLKFWRVNKTFEESLEKDSPKGEFVFYDGPPFANGLPHIGHLLASSIKDVVGRYKTMRGYHVRRRWGWDTHGLPIETLVEKELGLKTKKDIENIGVEKFNEKARQMVFGFEREWEKYVERIGRWVDFKNSYKTMDNTFIESVWWALKQLWEKELLYEGRKVLMYCPHCETPLAKAEIAMDNTYKDVTEEAVTVKFKVKNPEAHGLPANTYLLAWTTTPWTLPGNVALAVESDIAYVLAESSEHDGFFIMSKNIIGEDDPKEYQEFKGGDLVGIEYEPLFVIKEMQTEKSHRVYAADFVTTNDGTGIVHTAVMYGEDDFILGQKEGLPMVQMLNPNGTYNDVVPTFLRGKYIKDAEKEIKRDLDTRGLLFEKKNHTHSYPHCYRCGTPLIYNAVSSWFINIQKVKDRMVSENKKITWVPEHLRDGRFGNIVASAPDWTISRNRFWASPLPIWKEVGGSGVMVIGSVDELRKRVKKRGNTFFVMRHGESECNVTGIINSDNSIKNNLTEKGKVQARESVQKLAGVFDLIVTSPLARAVETAEIVREHLKLSKDKMIVDERLKEIQFGSLNNGPREAYISAFSELKDRSHETPGGAENWTSIRKRVGDALYDLDRTYENKRILIVTHDTPGFLLLAVARGETNEEAAEKHPPEYEDLHFKNAEAQEVPFAPLPLNGNYELDLHRPYTDSLVLLDDTGKEYERISEVVDCWVESGSMPFAELHYPFENKAQFEAHAPGDFITEYIAQTRTWFYYMHAMGVLLFSRLAFKAVVSTGTILAADGEKMSKSKGNYTDPLANLDRYGADAMRLYLLGSVVMQAEDLRFRDEELRDAHNRTIGILWNSYKFFELYKHEYDMKAEARSSQHVLDRWIIARLDETTIEMTEAMDAYDTPRACRAIRSFVDDYSTWYVRRSRERVKSEWHEKQYALATQREALLVFSRLIAPIMPFLAESMWQGLGERPQSVHLSAWPVTPGTGFFARFFGVKKNTVLEDMQKTRAVVSRALEARDKAGIKVRQPLARLHIPAYGLSQELLDVIRDEVNVKGVEQVGYVADNEVSLDTVITPELQEEGNVRELVRAIQAARKEAGLNPHDKARTRLGAAGAHEWIERNLETLTTATNSESISFGDVNGTGIMIGGQELRVQVAQPSETT